jgi:hypothetical protein
VNHSTNENHENLIILKRLERLDSREKFKNLIEKQILSLFSKLRPDYVKNEINQHPKKHQVFEKYKKNQKETSRINGVW